MERGQGRGAGQFHQEVISLSSSGGEGRGDEAFLPQKSRVSCGGGIVTLLTALHSPPPIRPAQPVRPPAARTRPSLPRLNLKNKVEQSRTNQKATSAPDRTGLGIGSIWTLPPERGHSCPQQASTVNAAGPVSKPTCPSGVAADRNVRAPVWWKCRDTPLGICSQICDLVAIMLMQQPGLPERLMTEVPDARLYGCIR